MSLYAKPPVANTRRALMNEQAPATTPGIAEVYDLALSFAGEQRHYVNEVVLGCQDAGMRVFYDEQEQASLWGRNLTEHLSWIYSHGARYCVMFISVEYLLKTWTRHEWRAAQERILVDGDYLLPVRFDDTSVPGLPANIGYIDARQTSPSELVSLLSKKLAGQLDPAPWATDGLTGSKVDRRLAASRPETVNQVSGTLHGSLLQTRDLTVAGDLTIGAAPRCDDPGLVAP
jgi:TIR domain